MSLERAESGVTLHAFSLSLSLFPPSFPPFLLPSLPLSQSPFTSSRVSGYLSLTVEPVLPLPLGLSSLFQLPCFFLPLCDSLNIPLSLSLVFKLLALSSNLFSS